jgi:excinuclease ABC subunit B
MVTLSQVHAMYGVKEQKENLVEYGFRLPAAMDNRPLKFEEFEAMQKTKYCFGYPADYELQKNRGCRCRTSNSSYRLLDPVIEIRPSLNQIDDLIEETYHAN